jgi:hypothetical protein
MPVEPVEPVMPVMLVEPVEPVMPVMVVEPVDDDAIGALVVLLPPQAASRPLMTTATEMILSSSSRLGLMTENRFMASPLPIRLRTLFPGCYRRYPLRRLTLCFQPVQLADALAGI